MNQEKEYCKPNIELVKKYINKKNPTMYSFRLENPELKDNEIGIVNFKKFRIDTSNFDCDRCELSMSIWCILLENSVFVKEVIGYVGRNIKYIDKDNNEIIVETDTMNSLGTELNRFIRKLIKKRFNTTWVNLYTSGTKIVDGNLVDNYYEDNLRKETERNRDLWFLDNYKELFDCKYMTADEIEELNIYNKMAQIMHTIGNFIIGPIGFNFSDRKAKSKNDDRFDLFMEKVLCDKEYEDWKQWFLTAKSVIFIDYYFKEGFNIDTKETDIICLREKKMINIEFISKAILHRSEKIIDKLRDILN